VIGVDMFLNLVTTSATEAGELLVNLGTALLIVVVLYVPMLLWAITNLLKKRLLSRERRATLRKYGVVSASLGVLFLILSYLFVPHFSPSKDIFPVNVVKNLVLAIDRIMDNKNYPETSKDFSFGAQSEHGDAREVYVVVIGETSRADNYGLLGYERNTTPLLAKRDGVVAFDRVMSESNTTHKSVPMLLSLVDAENYDDINRHKSIITAFKEAGFYTAYLSSQPFNRSYIDYFGNEADYVNFINGERTGANCLKDNSLLGAFRQVLSTTKADKVAIFIHTYGSHFNYSDRYERRFAYFKPDNARDASKENRAILLNAYDNSIRHTDYILNDIIERLSEENALTALMYVPDHGEDIFDDSRNRFLHASPTPTYWQLHVPMIIWMSSAYREAYPNEWAQVNARKSSQVSSSRSFAPTVLDIAGIRTERVEHGSAVSGSCYVEPKRYYISDRNECLPLTESGMKELDFGFMDKKGIKY